MSGEATAGTEWTDYERVYSDDDIRDQVLQILSTMPDGLSMNRLQRSVHGSYANKARVIRRMAREGVLERRNGRGRAKIYRLPSRVVPSGSRPGQTGGPTSSTAGLETGKTGSSSAQSDDKQTGSKKRVVPSGSHRFPTGSRNHSGASEVSGSRGSPST